MQRDRELARAQVGAEVTADLPDGVDYVRAHLLGEVLKLLLGELVQILRSLDLREQPTPCPLTQVPLGVEALLGGCVGLAAHDVRV
jgi:hypothetical protein